MNDAIYRELFDAKRYLYNSDHNLKIRGIEVELYVQDSEQAHVSLGEYSVLNNKWTHFPKKRRANFDDIATQSKYNKILSIAEYAIKSQDAEKIDRLIATIKKYRQAGLDARGEFSTENLVFKRLRTNGVIKALYDTKDDLHSRQLSLVESVRHPFSWIPCDISWDDAEAGLEVPSVKHLVEEMNYYVLRT